jgi:hypothetical protein
MQPPRHLLIAARFVARRSKRSRGESARGGMEGPLRFAFPRIGEARGFRLETLAHGRSMAAVLAVLASWAVAGQRPIGDHNQVPEVRHRATRHRIDPAPVLRRASPHDLETVALDDC